MAIPKSQVHIEPELTGSGWHGRVDVATSKILDAVIRERAASVGGPCSRADLEQALVFHEAATLMLRHFGAELVAAAERGGFVDLRDHDAHLRIVDAACELLVQRGIGKVL